MRENQTNKAGKTKNKQQQFTAFHGFSLITIIT